ncbi:hypothetical protein E2C01_084755 [Portunus trituberculatus]|uniref:Uncharacterized protein n=1 Tax=Portunus trituberculatus TaxID=210409 RepID=A0A5B7J4V4_PORTR|nr:hypothetical protein [Portunus trituberculatus]
MKARSANVEHNTRHKHGTSLHDTTTKTRLLPPCVTPHRDEVTAIGLHLASCSLQPSTHHVTLGKEHLPTHSFRQHNDSYAL